MTHNLPLKENQPMTSQPAEQLFAAAIPNFQWPSWFTPFQVGGAALFAIFSSMNIAVRWMWIGVFFHMLTTVLCVWYVPNGKGDRHIKKDMLIKGLALLLVWLMGKEPGLQFEVSGISISAGALFAGYYLCGEWLGVAKDMEELGVRFFPKWAKEGLQRASDGLDNAKVVGSFTNFTSNTVGTTEVITKAETVVVEKSSQQDKP